MINQEKRLYQLISSRLEGDRIHDEAYRREILDLVAKGIGGFILFGSASSMFRAPNPPQ